MELTQTKKDLYSVIIRKYINGKGHFSLDRGSYIYKSNAVVLKNINWDSSLAEFAVKSSTTPDHFYSVVLSDFNSLGMKSSCTCPYEHAGICKHQVAACYYLLNNLSGMEAPSNSSFNSNQKAAVTKAEFDPLAFYTVPLTSIDSHSVLRYISWNDYNAAKQLYDSGKVKEEFISNNRGAFKVTYQQKEYYVTIESKPDNKVLLLCNCFTQEKKICIHKAAALQYMLVKFGNFGLNFLKNLDEEKEKLLREFGYSLKDDIKGKFEFYQDANSLNIRQIDKSLQRIPGSESFQNWREKFFGADQTFDDKIKQLNTHTADALVFLFIKNKENCFPATLFKIANGRKKKNGELSRSLNQFGRGVLSVNMAKDDAEKIIIKNAIEIDNETLSAPYIKNAWNGPELRLHELNENDYLFLQKKIANGLEEIFQCAPDKTFYTGTRGYSLNDIHANLEMPCKLSPHRLKVQWVVSEDDEHVILDAIFVVDEKEKKIAEFEKFSDWLWIQKNQIYKLDNINDLLLIEKLNAHYQFKYRTKDFATIFNTMIKPLSKKNKVVVKSRKHEFIEGIKPLVNLYLKEYDKFLLLQPRFEYVSNDFKEEAELFSKNEITFTENDVVFTIIRDLNFEQEYTMFFKSLHPDFENNNYQEFFHIPFDKVMHKGWFFDLFEKLKQRDVKVFGQNELQKIKYNPNRPSFEFKSSSGIDWFELKIQVSFGDEVVPLSALRNALMNKQFYVPLSDGTIGLLPEEWLAKYSRLFKIGKVADDELHVSKMHFNMIDEFILEIDNEELFRELQLKKQKLLNFQNITTVALPQHVKAKLRHYQEDGFQWLNFLDEFGWGGCLADDMGLGKTLQVLAFLQHLKNEKRLDTCLVVVPTTLIFNWNNEVEKYCRKLKVLTHRGVDREVNHDVFGKYDIVLTTYGTLRSDIEDFKEFNFHYVILDESQAIKNPVSLISKAVRLLKAKNRLVMTGTPIENNTFDLYSQLEFLNPGFLGSQEFFRTEFATAIDKYADETKAAELRKMIAPFVLKRTKEEVAKDLPEKTETILYCEMGKAQRKVYDAFKKKYREEILELMNEGGMPKAGFKILEGLLKLRMICDSPVLVGDAENDYGTESAKLEELVREISENAGHHKILVFSQFLKMLDLIKQHLETLNISYQYMDGQTTDRKLRIDNFQNDDSVRVFLVSLKTGGVGINLTEADYVYLVDPWWNPAVERQAIDRTHRIGQKKNVFAYKMICTGTIEEKIIQLQEKKKTLASNLIDTEKNILKKLNKDDIVELFA